MAAKAGEADLIIVPKFEPKLSDQINKALGSVDTSGGTAKIGQGISAGLGKTGAIMGAFSALTSKAMGVVASSVGSAVARVDTLNNFPKIMTSLGVSSGEATASMQTMSDALSNVPTRLDDMANTVQGLYAATSKYGLGLGTVTDAGLALNSMLLAGGQSTQVVNSAMEQFRQMVAKGKPDLQDWRALISAAPGEMNKLAQEMLGAAATADDLYAALGGGVRDASNADIFGTLGMDQFITKFAEMRSRFESDAQDAQAGIGTAFSNMQNAVTRGVAGVIEAFGQTRISSAINDVKSMINNAFSDMGRVAQGVAPVLSRMWDNLSPAIPALAGAAIGFTALKTGMGAVQGLGSGVISVFTGLASKATAMSEATGLASKATALLGTTVNPAAIGVGALAIGLGTVAYSAYDAWKRNQEFNGAIAGVAESAMRATEGMNLGTRSVTDYAGAMRSAKPDVDGVVQSMQDYVSKTEAIRDAAAGEISLLGQYKSIIDECAGAQEVSTEQAGKLQWALDGLAKATGETFSMEEVLTGQYRDEAGAIQSTKDAIDSLIAKRQEEIRTQAISEQLTESYKLRAKAANELTVAQEALAEKEQWLNDYAEANNVTREKAIEMSKANGTAYGEEAKKVEQLQQAYDAASSACEQNERALGNATEAINAQGNAITDWISNNELAMSAVDRFSSVSLTQFSKALSDAGVSSEMLARVGERNFNSMMAQCNGDVDKMIRKIAEFNGVKLDAKKSIISASGNVVEGIAEKAIRGANSAMSSMVSKAVNAIVQGNALTASGPIWNTVNAINGLYSKTVNVVTNFVSNVKSALKIGRAAGGIRLNAAGGIRYHADGGAIVNAPKVGYPLDMVGEDGAEAIVPLTNKRYSKPFADLIAEEVARRAAQGPRGGVDIHDCTFIVRKESDVSRVSHELDTLIWRRTEGSLA